jgi:hypothetical protein
MCSALLDLQALQSGAAAPFHIVDRDNAKQANEDS